MRKQAEKIIGVMRVLKRGVMKRLQSKAERRHVLVGPPKLWRMKRDFQIRFLKANGLRAEHYLLDIGCGTLRGGIPMIEYLEGGHYFGIESRPEVLDEGRKELKEAGLAHKKPTLLAVPDISELELDPHFDIVWAFSVLIHMSDEILADTMAAVSRHLSDTGVFYANVNIGAGKEGIWQGFPLVWRSLEFYRDEGSKAGLKVTDIGTLAEHGHVADVEAQDRQRMLMIAKG